MPSVVLLQHHALWPNLNSADLARSSSSVVFGGDERREMQMNILTVNLVFSTVVFAIAAKLYLIPILPRLEPRTVVLPILLLHALRHLGLMFLAPGAVFPGMPGEFACPAAFGDLLAAAWRSSPLPRSSAGRGSRGRWSRSSTSRARSISCLRSRSPPFTALRRTWGPPIGSRRSGCRRCW